MEKQGRRWERVVSGSSSDNWSIFGELFITEDIAVSAAYTDFERVTIIDGLDGDTYTLAARYRFQRTRGLRRLKAAALYPRSRCVRRRRRRIPRNNRKPLSSVSPGQSLRRPPSGNW